MPSKMLQFVRVGAAMPEKRGAGDRRRDFREIYDGFDPAEAADVLDAYAGRGLRERRRVDSGGWVVAELERG